MIPDDLSNEKQPMERRKNDRDDGSSNSSGDEVETFRNGPSRNPTKLLFTFRGDHRRELKVD